MMADILNVLNLTYSKLFPIIKVLPWYLYSLNRSHISLSKAQDKARGVYFCFSIHL